MKKRANNTRFKNYYKWESIKNSPYNYERNGLLKHLMPKKIINTNNTTLKMILSYLESTLVFIMRYVDILKNFKNIHWKNR